MTGCTFASQMSKDKKLALYHASQVDHDMIDLFFLQAGLDFEAAVAVFSAPRSIQDMIQTLCSLLAGERWRGRVFCEDDDSFCITMEWKTADGLWSNCMGLGPLFSLPVTRRAPYLGLALWPGPPRRREGCTGVSFYDIRHGLPKDTRESYRERTTKRVNELMGTDKEMSWRDITFRLNLQWKAEIEPFLESE